MTKLMAMALLLLMLAGCGSSQPFGKSDSEPAKITHPPWEALVAAGPGASQDIDLETLNGPLEPASPVEPELAIADAPAVATEVTTTQSPAAKKPGTGPEIKAVAVPMVKGAAAAGNDELTAAMRQTLKSAGWTVLTKAGPGALTIQGSVQLAPAQGAKQTVSLQWNVALPDGRSLGNVSQANDVAAGSLDGGWGENAVYATEAAATGIFELINKFR